MKKTVYIKLKFARRVDSRNYPSFSVNYYIIEQLRNAASISVGPKFFRVNDDVTPEEADKLCDIKRYEVTINN